MSSAERTVGVPGRAFVRSAVVALVCLAATTAAFGSDAPDCPRPDARTLESILPVATERGGRASGVVIAPDRVLTAAHAVSAGAGEHLFVRVGEAYRPAAIALLDRATDLAVLDVDTGGIEPLPLAARAPVAHRSVWAVGFPGTAARRVSGGVLQREGDGVLHASAPIDAGQSGGALLGCERGAHRLLGVLRGYGAYRDGGGYTKLPNHSVSIAAATVRRVLTAAP